MSEKVKLTIDGIQVEAAAGESLLQVAMDNGAAVPHFCYHPGIGIEGSCRLCLVKLEGAPKLVTSCTIPVKDGMVVHTQSEDARAARKSVLEFFLLNHPLDCPFCDKGGECPLQNFTVDSGQFKSRFEFQKVHKAKHQIIGDHIILDKERCVLCDRCVRFGRDLAGHEELQIGKRGNHAEIFVPLGEKLVSKFTGNYADICPVGALTTREFRFKARPWELSTTDTVCTNCSVVCSVQAWKKNDEVLRLTPRIEPEVNEWWLCDRGRFAHHERAKESVQGVFVKTGSNHLPSTVEAWAQSVYQASQEPSAHIVCMLDAKVSNEKAFELQKAEESSNGKLSFYLPTTKRVKELYHELKSQNAWMTSPSLLETCDSVVIVGEALEDHHPVLALRLRRLAHTKKIAIHTVGCAQTDLSDVRSADWGSDANEIDSFLTAYFNKNAAPSTWSKRQANAWNALLQAKKVAWLISDQALSSVQASTLSVWKSKFQNPAEHMAALLLDGSNLRGLLDQFGVEARTLDDFKAADQNVTTVWLESSGLNAELSDLRNHVASQIDLHTLANPMAIEGSRAHWHLPSIDGFQVTGTFTNTFGKVQIIRHTHSIGSRITCSHSVALGALAKAFGGNQLQSSQHDPSTIYELAVINQQGYPKKLQDIAESKETYDHYERALWR